LAGGIPTIDQDLRRPLEYEVATVVPATEEYPLLPCDTSAASDNCAIAATVSTATFRPAWRETVECGGWNPTDRRVYNGLFPGVGGGNWRRGAPKNRAKTSLLRLCWGDISPPDPFRSNHDCAPQY